MKNEDVIKQIHKSNDKVERMIHKKNIHSVYHKCIKHGFGINFPFDNKCPDCDNETFLYISAEDVLTILLSEIKKVREECYEQMSEIIGEDEIIDYDHELPENVNNDINEGAISRNYFRAEQRSKLQALKDKDKKEMITKVIEQANADQRAVVEGEKV